MQRSKNGSLLVILKYIEFTNKVKWGEEDEIKEKTRAVLPEGFSPRQVQYGFGEIEKRKRTVLGVKGLIPSFILQAVG